MTCTKKALLFLWHTHSDKQQKYRAKKCAIQKCHDFTHTSSTGFSCTTEAEAENILCITRGVRQWCINWCMILKTNKINHYTLLSNRKT